MYEGEGTVVTKIRRHSKCFRTRAPKACGFGQSARLGCTPCYHPLPGPKRVLNKLLFGLLFEVSSHDLRSFGGQVLPNMKIVVSVLALMSRILEFAPELPAQGG